MTRVEALSLCEEILRGANSGEGYFDSDPTFEDPFLNLFPTFFFFFSTFVRKKYLNFSVETKLEFIMAIFILK